MSYPLANLPYGLRCRFREFSTPCEAYNFGVVAPTFLGQKYDQKAVTCDKVTAFLNENSEPIARVETLNKPDRMAVLHETDFYAAGQVCLEGVSPQYLEQFDFNHCSIQLSRCHFTGGFMQRRWCNPTKLCIDNCTFTEGFHLGHLCAVLRPTQVVLKYNQLDGSWVDMFLMADTGCTRHLSIETNSIDVLKISERTLWELFMVQGHNDFYVEIDIDADESLIAETLSRQFQNDFFPVDTNGYIRNTHIVLRIACKNSLKNWFFEMREEESEY